MNVVADTNVVISAIFWPGESRRCFALWARRRFHLAITVPIFEEYGEVARRVSERIGGVNPDPWIKWIETKAKVYVVESMTKGWVETWKRKKWWHSRTSPVLNRDLWERLMTLCETHQVEFRWVKGHAGHVENERCDQLAMEALRQTDLPIDEGYENKSDGEGTRPELQEGEPCYKCSTPVIKQVTKSKPKGEYYYEFYLWCPKCSATYTVESAKKLIEQSPSLL